LFSHLRTHSYYSFLEGLPSPVDLAQAAKTAGMRALALTDHNGLAGAIEFYEACLGFDVQPILGLEIDVAAPPAPGARLVLLAADMEGWGSLCRLSSLKLGEAGEMDGPLPFERFSQETGGLICLTGGRGGPLASLLVSGQAGAAGTLLGRLKETFGSRLYVELQRHTPQDDTWVAGLVSLARAAAVPLVATHDIYYINPEQRALQRLVSAMRLNQRLHDLPKSQEAPPEAGFLSQEEMQRRFSDFPQALAATQEIADRCRLQLPLGVPHYPEAAMQNGGKVSDVSARLRLKALAGAQSLYGQVTPEIQARLDHELAVIQSQGYSSLFLIMEEIVQFARKSGIPMSSRGSAASSLVAHCLGITSPDPMRHNLYFERFLNPARTTPPDIDTDLCSRRRDEVIRFVYQRFGDERVAMVCTTNRFRRRSALREVAKAYGLPPAEIKAMVDALPYRWYGPRQVSGDVPYAELAGRYHSSHHQQIFRHADAILGMPHHLSIHPGGVVIAPGRMTDLVPVQLAPKGVVITQFDLDSTERLGLLKIDLLGIRGLTVVGDVAGAVYAAQPQAYAAPLDVLEGVPDDDAATADLVRNGRTVGCFQIESPGMRATLREIGANCIDDLMVALALYRPGPLTGGLKDAFVRRHRGEEAVTHLHPALAPLLDDTYGVILYQEQVLRIAHELAGLSLADSDLLRRAMSHFDPGKQMQTLKERFIAGAALRSHVPENVAERIWELMAAFAGYGFPKAHAASYAQVSWRAAWCKAHHPAVFMAAVLANWGGYYGQGRYLMEARHLGLAVRPPHINFSLREFGVSYVEDRPVLFMGLDQVRDLTRRTQSRIISHRPFHSLGDFLARVDPRPVEAENLVQAGALDGFGSIPALLSALKSPQQRGGQLSLFPLEVPEQADWPLEQQAAAQQAVLGVSVSIHPLELIANRITEANALSTVDAAARVGQLVRVAGIRQGWRRQAVGRETIYSMSLEDLEGELEIVISAPVYQRYRQEFSSRDPLVVEGVLELDSERGEPFIRVEKAWKIA
jgi:DNA polymerase-3 subunit alpha